MWGWHLRERRAAYPEDCGVLGILSAGWLRRGLREEQQGKFERTLSEIAVCGRGASDGGRLRGFCAREARAGEAVAETGAVFWKQAEGSDFRI
jgi:hypothetical protein